MNHSSLSYNNIYRLKIKKERKGIRTYVGYHVKFLCENIT